MLFKKKNPENIIEGLDKALEILQERYEKKTITLEEFSKKCEQLGKKREKHLKKLEKQNINFWNKPPTLTYLNSRRFY